MAWLVLWCWGVLSGAAGWAWRNTPVFACMSVVSPWPLACPWWGSGGREYWLVSKAPLSPLDAVHFLGCGKCVPQGYPAGYMCRSRPSVPGV